jgi:hypothetical protein
VIHYLQIWLHRQQHAQAHAHAHAHAHAQLDSSSTAVEQNLKTFLNNALSSLCNLRQGKRSTQKLEKFEKSIKMLIKNLDYLLGGYLKSN